QRLEILLEQKTIDYMTTMSALSRDNDKRILGSMIDPVISAASVTSGTTGNANQYWIDRYNAQQVNISARQDANAARIAYVLQPGSGNNEVQRFDFLKRIFDKELSEAYRRAQAIVIGLKLIYGIDKPLPELSDVGYLSALSLWEKDVFYLLEQRMMRSKQTTIAIGLRKYTADANSLPGLIPDADFQTQRAAGIFKFTLPASFFDNTTTQLKSPR